MVVRRFLGDLLRFPKTTAFERVGYGVTVLTTSTISGRCGQLDGRHDRVVRHRQRSSSPLIPVTRVGVVRQVERPVPDVVADVA